MPIREDMLCKQCGSVLSAVTFTCVRGDYCKPLTYRAQSARDAQAANYGDKSYWDHLEQMALEHTAKGVTNAFEQSLSEALVGNDGN